MASYIVYMDEQRKLVLYTDGGCSHNDQLDVSKREMIAVVTDSTGAVLVERFQHGGSNNIAELLAVKEALAWAKDHGWDAVEIRTDSRNNFAWVDGRIGKKLNDRHAVLDLYQTIRRLREHVRMELVWVPREENLAGHYIEEKAGCNKLCITCAHRSRTQGLFWDGINVRLKCLSLRINCPPVPSVPVR